MENSEHKRTANRRTVTKLGLVVVGMFAFGFALVPLYSVICTLTGLNGKTGRSDAQAVERLEPDTNRWVTVQFIANVNHNMPWTFRPLQASVRVHPGQLSEAMFVARNRANHAITGQAVPSLAPNSVAKYFSKTECFCFTQQTLQAREERVMPLRFIVDTQLPEDVRTITLAYTFFSLEGKGVAAQGEVDPVSGGHG